MPKITTRIIRRTRGRPKGSKSKTTTITRYRSKMTGSRIFPKKIYTLPHRFSRWAAASSEFLDLDNTASFQSIGMNFSLDKVRNPSEFGVLFDQYRIDRVEVCLRWHGYSVMADLTVAGANGVTSLSGLAPILYYKKDYDDDTAPANLDVLNEAAKTKQFTLRPDRDYKITLTPACLTEIYRTSLATSYSPKFKQVLDMGTQNIPHYGLKLAVLKQPVPLGRVNIQVKYYFTCFNTR